MVRTAVLAALALAACRGKTIDGGKAAAVFDRVTLETGGANGLSGLAVDGDGALWSVAERDQVGFRIELDGIRIRSITRVPVEGVPKGNDLEAIGWAGGDRFWVGTEGKDDGIARVFALRLEGGVLRGYQTRELTIADAGLAIGSNHGAEGLCVVGDTVVAAIETASKGPDRWAPVIAIDADDRRVLHRLHLTSDTGKLSALDCWRDGDRTVVIAIERHFGVTRILGFDLPAAGGDLTPTVLLDLGPVLRGALNLEGLARLPDGRLVAVVDNQYGKITGPNELVIFKARPADRRPVPAR